MLIERAKALMFFAFLGALACIPISNSLFEICSGTYIGLGLLLVSVQGRWALYRRKLFIPALVFLAVCAASIAVSEFPENSVRGAFRVFRCVLMALFALYVVDTEKKFKAAFLTIAGVMTAVCIDALIQAALGRDLLWSRPLTPYFDKTGRVTGPFHHANDFSAYLTLATFTLTGMFTQVWPKAAARTKALFLAAIVVSGLALLWTYARGAWLSVGAAWAAMLVFKRDRKLIAWTALALIVALVVSPPMVRKRVASLWSLKDGTISERRILWDESIRMWKDKPVLGHGINTYSKVGSRYKSPDVYTDFQYPHNGYLHMAAETGVLGLGAFLAFLGAFFVSNRRFLGKQEQFVGAAASALIFGIFAFLLHSFTDTNLQSLRLVSFLWLSMGLVIAAQRIAQPR